MSNEDLSSTKLDLILQQVNKTNVAIEKISGDMRVQDQVIVHLTSQYHELKSDTKNEFIEVKKQHERFDVDIDDLKGFKKWLFGAAAGIGMIAAVITSGIISLLQKGGQ